jgi:hypothetical protein
LEEEGRYETGREHSERLRKGSKSLLRKDIHTTEGDLRSKNEARSALAQNGRDLSFGNEKSRLLETFFLNLINFVI